MSVRTAICPRFDSCDPRCGARMTLGHLDEVFRFCTAEYESCPVYRGDAVGRSHPTGGRASRVESEVGCQVECEVECEVGAEIRAEIGGVNPRFGLCDGPVADDLADIAEFATVCIGKVVELTIERSPLGRPAVA